LKKERNISIAFIFLAPFLAFIQLEYVFITLIPMIIAEVIIAYNNYMGNGTPLKSPVVIRDGFIQIDQYPNVIAALHDDNFLEMEKIEAAEIVQYVTNNRRRGEEREQKRIIFHTRDKKQYSIEREDWTIRNVVSACIAWNESRIASKIAMFMERDAQFASFNVGEEQIIGTSEIQSTKYRILKIIIFALMTITALYLFYYFIKSGTVDDTGSILLLSVFTLFFSFLLMFSQADCCWNGISRPPAIIPIGMKVEEEKISIRLQRGEVLSFPWSAVIGISGTSTADDNLHPYILDLLFLKDKKWGVIILDDLMVYVEIKIADEVQSIFTNKFGFSPNRYWFFTEKSFTDNYSQIQKCPRIKWREARKKRINPSKT
jgi:hypothetical protein